MSRSSPTLITLSSLVAIGLLCAALYRHSRTNTPQSGNRPLIVYAAAAVRAPMEAIAHEYYVETGRAVELRFGASEDILTRAALINPLDPADLFLPADDSYIDQASARGLTAEVLPIAQLRPVVLLAKGNKKAIATWSDLTREGVSVAVPNRAAAVGKLTREHLAKTGRWAQLQPRAVDTGTVTEAANAAKIGSVDAAIVWDGVAAQEGYAGQEVLKLPELDGVVARVKITVLNQSSDHDAALRFAHYVSAADRGLKEFRERGFNTTGSANLKEPKK